MFIPTVSASKVAGLIGLNPYQDAHEIMYDLLCKNKLIRARIAELEERAHRKPFQEVVESVLEDPSIRGIVSAGVRSCQKTTDVQGVLSEVERTAKTAIDLRYSQYAPEVQSAIVSEIRGKVQKQRGLNNENHILDQYEKKHDVKVVERNTKNMRRDFGKFVLIGRTDGWVASENRIVDSKERTRFWAQVPMYDEIQLRCYMAMMDAPEAELVERFPDGRARVTKFMNDPDKWQSIQEALESAVDTMRRAVADPEELKRIVVLNTVDVIHGGSARDQPAGGVSERARLDV